MTGADPEQVTEGDSGRYFGLSQSEVVALTGAPRALLFDAVSSTMDVAHQAAAAGAPAGTIVLAERQLAGRGQAGRAWVSEEPRGVWLTLLARPWEGVPVELLSIRAGLALAPALDRFAAVPVGLKWPNDLYARGHKLGGILVEARWRDAQPEWVAIGVGVNLAAPPGLPHAGALRDGVSAVEVVAAIVPALRSATTRRGRLSTAELRAFAQRDVAAGKQCVQPQAGTVRGISESGELLIESPGGSSAHRSGSLVLEGGI